MFSYVFHALGGTFDPLQLRGRRFARLAVVKLGTALNASGDYGPDNAHKSEFMACNRSHVEFKMDDLWNASW